MKIRKLNIFIVFFLLMAFNWFLSADYQIEYHKGIGDEYWSYECDPNLPIILPGENENVLGQNMVNVLEMPIQFWVDGNILHSNTCTMPPEVYDVTAYSELDSCHYPGCPMANGKKAEIGYIACPREIELGTKVEIEGKTYECGDRTAKRYDGRFDVFMGYGEEAHREALNFGIRKLIVAIQ